MAPDASDTPMATRHGQTTDTVDRALIGGCAAIWLILVAVSVVAIVALIDMGRGHPASDDSGHSSWLLYGIIAVSAAIIVAAVPLLLRARRAAAQADGQTESATLSEETAAPVRPIEARTGRMRVFGTSVDPYDRPLPESQPVSLVSSAVLNRVWLRGTVSLVGAIGLALTGVAAMTYLLATASVTAAWVALGFAGVITVAMPAILVAFQRQMDEVVEEAAA